MGFTSLEFEIYCYFAYFISSHCFEILQKCLQARRGKESEWITLSKHDYSESHRPPTIYDVDSWRLEDVKDFYNQFKILMTGKTWGVNEKWWALRFCGFELYGEMY